MSMVALFFYLLLLLLLPSLHFVASDTGSHMCPGYRCGNDVEILYPFWVDNCDDKDCMANASHCGYPSLRLECRHDTPVLRLPSGDYGVTRIVYEDRSLSVVDLALTNTTCPHVAGRNVTLPSGSPPPLSLTTRNINFTFFLDCVFTLVSDDHLLRCLQNGPKYSYVFRDARAPYNKAGQCQQVVSMPVLNPLDSVVLALQAGFELSWRSAVGGQCSDCEKAGGLCGQRREVAHDGWMFTCLSRIGTPTSPPASESPGANMFIIIAISAVALVATLGLVHCIAFWRNPVHNLRATTQTGTHAGTRRIHS